MYRSSGGFAITRVGTGIYKVEHASFTANTRLSLTAYTPAALTVKQYAALNAVPGAGFNFIAALDHTPALSDAQFSVTLMTFPQML